MKVGVITVKIITKKKLKQETYVLDYSLIKWLNEHLKIYLKETEGIIDLTFHKFTYKKQEYTQLEIVNRLIEITDYLSEQDEYYLNMDKQKERLVKEMYDLLKLIHFYLWW